MNLRILIAVLLFALLLTACGPAAPDSLPASGADSLAQSVSEGAEQPPESESLPELPENEDYRQIIAAADPEQYILTNFVRGLDEGVIPQATALRLLDHYAAENRLDLVVAVDTADQTDVLYQIHYKLVRTQGVYRFEKLEKELYAYGTAFHHKYNTDKTKLIQVAELRPDVISYFLTDLQAGRTRLIARHPYRMDNEHGFFKNGDLYIMSGLGLTIYPGGIQDSGIKFTTATNFPCGKGYDPDQPDRERWLLALRREEDQQSYIVMYAECTPDETGSYPMLAPYRLTATYQVGILDAQGRLATSWDTFFPCYYDSAFERVSMSKPDENHIEFTFASSHRHEAARIRVDLTTGECTEITE